MMNLPPSRSLALATVLLLAAAAGAEEINVRDLKPVDPAVEDTGPLSVSLREFQVDLRGPVGFEHIYRVPGHEDELYMRVDGGLYAVFPQSVYTDTRWGPVPMIPNATIFYIGSASMDALVAPDWSPQELWQDPLGLRIDSRIVPESDSPNDAQTSPAASASLPPRRAAHPYVLRPAEDADRPGIDRPAQTIATDASYRADRLRELMRRAAHAADQPGE